MPEEAIRPVLQDAFDAVTEADIAEFERRLGASLPRDYRAFLGRQNGGCYLQEVLYVIEHDRDYFDVSDLRALNVPARYSYADLWWHYRTFVHEKNRSGVLPIASTGTGDHICTLLDHGPTSPIILWDHESGVGNAREVSASFTEFLKRIEYNPESEQFVETIPVFRAAERGDCAALQIALTESCGLEERNDRHQTPLMCAAVSAQPRTVQQLIEAGADVDAVDQHGRSALWLVADSVGAIDVTRQLIDAGASIDCRDSHGGAPLMRAVASGRLRMAELLAKCGASWELADQNGRTPQDMANSANDADVLLEIRNECDQRG